AFAPAEPRRILRRLEFHFTPKHASWLKMVECEISVLQRQCLGRRIDDPKRLRNAIAPWQRRRTKPRASIKWMLTTSTHRTKLDRASPAGAKESNALVVGPDVWADAQLAGLCRYWAGCSPLAAHLHEQVEL